MSSLKSIFVGILCITIIVIIFGYHSTAITKQQEDFNTKISILENQNNVLIQENEKLIGENEELISENKKIIFDKQEALLDSQLLFSRSQSALSEAGKKVTENQKLVALLDQISDQQDSLINTILQFIKSGQVQSLKSGYIPIFRFTTDPVDKELQQKTLSQISQGSYCNKQEIVYYNLDDTKSWQDLGSWSITGYTPAAEENGGTHSAIATPNHLATPGFTLAIDHDYWEYGTIFFIEDFGFVIATDCGVGGKNRGDYLTTEDKLSGLVTGKHRVYLVYEP